MKINQVEKLIRLAQVMAYKLPETEQNELLRYDLQEVVKELRNPVIQKGENNA